MASFPGRAGAHPGRAVPARVREIRPVHAGTLGRRDRGDALLRRARRPGARFLLRGTDPGGDRLPQLVLPADRVDDRDQRCDRGDLRRHRARRPRRGTDRRTADPGVQLVLPGQRRGHLRRGPGAAIPLSAGELPVAPGAGARPGGQGTGAPPEDEHRATHDLLTGLPNRAQFIRLADREIEAARSHGSWVALMFIDLDGFKPINDTHGHAVGDEVLKILAQRMRNCLKGSDTVARLGGDEFGAVVALPPEAAGSAERVAAKILDTVSQPIALGARRIVLSAGFGVALFPCHGDDAQTLISVADTSMYEVKRAGKAGVRLASGDQTP
ncbi:MAG: GGDEF domain-containing protein [Comamonadaceae bacterium]|nr:GGDEF domain-containing protein [Comamonadaceae bacterium]